MRVKALTAVNTEEHAGKDCDDALGAAFLAMLAAAPPLSCASCGGRYAPDAPERAGRWERIDMVQKYAHLAPTHLTAHAETVTFLVTADARKETAAIAGGCRCLN